MHLHHKSSSTLDTPSATAAGESDAAEASPRASPPRADGRRGSWKAGQSVGHTLRRKVMLLFACPDICIFFAMATLFGFAAGNIDGFLFLYLEELGGPKVLMGLTITVGEAPETLSSKRGPTGNRTSWTPITRTASPGDAPPNQPNMAGVYPQSDVGAGSRSLPLSIFGS